MAEEGQAFRGDQHLDASRHSRLTADQAGPFKGQDDLVHGRRSDLEMALHVGFGWGTAMVFGPKVWCVGSMMNRSGCSVQVLQMYS